MLELAVARVESKIAEQECSPHNERQLVDFAGLVFAGCVFWADNALIDRLAIGKALVGAVPVSNLLLSQFPTEKNRLSLHEAGKIEESNVKVLHLHADGVDFVHCVFHALERLIALSAAARIAGYVDQQSSRQEDPVGERLKFAVDFLHQLFPVDGSANEPFEHGQHRLRFFVGECAVGHVFYLYTSGFPGIRCDY